ncbi:MAG: TetR/AcrR family transcriptional regulator [Anaerolineales bacterium]|nr:TetR/AcrR family transcriptional regulator [Anaerolineales bacterium]
MMIALQENQSEARERVLQTAETLFHQRGYQAVTMRDLAEALDMRQASLYYHAPQGKEQLFVEVTERGLARHQQGLQQAIRQAGPDIQAQLQGVADWFVAQPPLKLFSMAEADMPALSEENASQLMQLAEEALFQPLMDAFAAAQMRGEIRAIKPERLAGLFLTMIEGILYTGRAYQQGPTPQALAYEMIDILLHGLRPC